MSRNSSIEVLESRIAPAVLFVSTNSLSVRTAAGDDAMDSAQETDARDIAGATAAVLLSKGDILVLDIDNDNQLSENDLTLARVNGGKAMFFLTDGVEGTPGSFDSNEITGLAVSHGFKGEISASIYGSIVTALDNDGAFTASTGTLNVQPASISGLKVEGYINGSLLAGESISKVKITTPPNGLAHYSVETIASGTKTSGVSLSLNGGATSLNTSFSFGADKNGGNITNVQLSDGAELIAAGDGAESTTGAAAGKGGSISKVTVTNSPFSVSLEAGDGGAAQGTGKGGVGGSLTNIRITQDGADSDVSFRAGDGGSAASGKGGAGGSISNLNLEVMDVAQNVTIRAGDGGDEAGRGGSISKLQLTTEAITGNLTVEAGDGGNISDRGRAGIGGSVTSVDISARSAAGDVSIEGGDAGYGVQEIGSGANGGSVQKLKLQLMEDSGRLQISGGSGGSGATAVGAGGNGGKIAKVTVDVAGLASARFTGGNGGSANDAAGGSGGAIQSLSFSNSGLITNDVQVRGGDGGTIGTGTSRAGSGGAVIGLMLENSGGLTTVDITSGAGGTFNGEAKGGRSGQVAKVTIDSSADIAQSVAIHSGTAGGPFGPASSTGNGETSGDIKGVAINDYFGATGLFSIYAGGGKVGKGEKAKGSSIGSISGVKLNAPESTVRIGEPDSTGAGGGPGVQSVGGSGGNITKISGSVGVLDIFAAGGGEGAKGGLGGSVSNVNIKEAGSHVHVIAAGDGGDGTIRAGAGGSVTKVKVAGDIGNFDAPFGMVPHSSSSPSMGGLATGMAGAGPDGKAGSVLKISADRIAAILAGTPAPDAITVENAVERIAGIRASVIGADVNRNSVFDFIDGNGEADFQIGTSDIPTDGLVIVKPGRYALPVEPLKQIVVDEEVL